MQDVKLMVYDALQIMADRQDVVADTHGNVSMRDDDGLLYIKPSGVDYHLIDQDDISIVDIETLELFAGMKPSVDTMHHARIYKLNHNIKAICHTHSPYATAYATARSSMPCYITEQADYFGGPVSVEQYADLNRWGDALGKRPSYHNAMLLQHHGVLTFADTAVDAVKLAVVLENISKKNFLIDQLISQRPNNCSPFLPFLEIEKWRKRYEEDYGQ